MTRWRRYLRFWGPDVDADIEDELRFHLEARIADYVAAGHSPDEAQRLATHRFGDVHGVRGRLRHHDMRKLQLRRRADVMDELMQDIRYGVRRLAQAPGFTLSVVAVLALGIGANAAIYSAIDAALFRPLPFSQPDRLVSLPGVEVPFNLGGPHPKSYADATDIAKLDVFQSFAVHATGGLNLEGGVEPKRVAVAHVTLDFFKTLGRFPVVGRTFTPEEEVSGGPHAALLSHRVWQTQFGGNTAIVGHTVSLNGVTYQVVGVMPSDFSYPSDADLWVPLPTPAGWDVFEAFKSYMNSEGIARLAPGVTLQQAGERVVTLQHNFSAHVTVSDSTIRSTVIPLQQSLLPRQRRDALVMLMASAALVLLIACANVVNLLLSRAVGRRREMAIRSVLGATRARILRQLVVESVLLTVAGALVGLLVARLGLVALSGLLPSSLTAVAPAKIDPRVLGFTLGIALITGIAFGLWPAIGVTRRDANETIKAGGAHGSTERDGRTVRSILVVVEMALALVLLVGAGLMLQSFRALMSTNAGVQTEHVTTAQVTLPTAKYSGRRATWTFINGVLERLRSAPGIQGAATVNVLPLAQQHTIGLVLRDAEGGRVDPNNPVAPLYLQVSPGYFETMGIPRLRGRDIAATDDSTTAAAVINKTMADALWPNQNPIGRHFTVGDTRTVVGVVGDVRSRRLDEKAEMQMYLPQADHSGRDFNFIVRGTLSAEAMGARIRDAVRSVDQSQAVYNVRSMNDVVSTSVAPRRTNTVLLVIFGTIAAMLAAIGVYAVLAYGVAQRTREIGVRLALGAQRGDVMRLVVAHGATLAGIGAAIGIAGAYALARLMENFLYEVRIHDARIFIGAPLLLATIALAATVIPAWRASRVDPVVALRED